MRRSRVIAAVAFVAVAGVVVAFRAPLLQRIVDARIDANLTRTNTGLLDDGQLHVVLCGTAAALPDPDRAGPCTAILADGQFLLIDAGPGSWRVLDGLNLPVARLSALLLTHLHSDHIGEVGEAVEKLLWLLDLDLLFQFLEGLLDLGFFLARELVFLFNSLVEPLLPLDDRLILLDC